MMKQNIIKYGALALIIVGIVLVMKNLVSSDTKWNEASKSGNTNSTYSVSIQLLDKETDAYISNAKLSLKDKNNKVIDEWTTGTGVHLVGNLKNGSYTLTQVEANSKYALNKENIMFKIEGKDKKVTMYNEALTEEEEEAQKTNEASNNENLSPTETTVESTSSFKNTYLYFAGIISVLFGMGLIFRVKRLK